MAVCGELKSKLIETKNAILEQLCKQIEDKGFEWSLFMEDMKRNQPLMYALMDKYESEMTKPNIDYHQICKQLHELIKIKCVLILSFITGEEVSPEDRQLLDNLMLAVNTLSQDLSETSELSKEFEKKLQKFQNIYILYLELTFKYYKNYKIPFKAQFDEMNCNLLMSKAQTLCVRKRLEKTVYIENKYGNKEKVNLLKAERKAVEREEKELNNELKKAQSLLEKFESLDPQLLKEYNSLKSEIECREWALNELNRSSLSTSANSINFSN